MVPAIDLAPLYFLQRHTFLGVGARISLKVATKILLEVKENC